MAENRQYKNICTVLHTEQFKEVSGTDRTLCKILYYNSDCLYIRQTAHIGNTYEIVLADAIARYKRSQGYDVFFQTGTDEHGQKIELKAEEAGITPKEFVDNASGEIKKNLGSDEYFL